MKIITAILSYNMPSITDSLHKQLLSLIKFPNNEFIVFDNGSDNDKVANCTTHRIDKNTRLTGGMNNILKIAKEKNADFLWLCTNDISVFSTKDPIENMIKIFKENNSIGIIHPSLKKEPVKNYAYPWMCKNITKIQEGYTIGHITYDIISPMFKKECLDLFNWEFDKRFEYGWGIDWDSAYICRKNNYKIAIDFNIEIEHQTSITYDSGNDKEFRNRQDYYKKASENMNKIMIEKYGTNWKKVLNIE
jgi:hypothetical protein